MERTEEMQKEGKGSAGERKLIKQKGRNTQRKSEKKYKNI
jgi:hypothetical protein